MKEFEAKVTVATENRVSLDKTCFFPRGGGQASDVGEIEGVHVLSTEYDENGNIVHFLDREATFQLDQTVRGKIDWDRRYKIMKLHSASHIVQYVIEMIFGSGFKPAGSGFVDEQKDRTDYFWDQKVDQEVLRRVEGDVNQIIRRPLEIKTWCDQDAPDHRYWQVECFRPMDCGGTHPRSTAEIGEVLLKRGKKPGHGKERIETYLAR